MHRVLEVYRTGPRYSSVRCHLGDDVKARPDVCCAAAAYILHPNEDYRLPRCLCGFSWNREVIILCYIPSCTVHTCYHGIYNKHRCMCSFVRATYNVSASSSFHAHRVRPRQGQPFTRAWYYTSFVTIRHAISTWQIILTKRPMASQCYRTERNVSKT